MTLVDRKTRTRARRTHARDLEGTGARGAVAAPAGHPQAQPRRATPGEPEPAGDSGVPPSEAQPAPESEPPAFGLLILVGAIFGLAVLKEFRRIGGPVVVKVKSVPRPPALFWIAGGVGTLGRIGARVLSR